MAPFIWCGCVFVLATTCLADASPSATSCDESACEQSANYEHVSNELFRINAGHVSVELLQRYASEDIDEDVEDYEDEELAEDVEEDEDEEVEDFFEDQDADEVDSPAPAPVGICKSKCEKQYNKFVKKGKEGLGFARICKKSFCADCSFCEGEFPTPAPTSPCRESCQKRYEQFVKKGKQNLGKEKLCKKMRCSGCDMCAEEGEAPPAPAPEESPTFTKVEDNRYWGCARKGMGSVHGFGHATVEKCFAATLKDPACKGQFDYNQRYNGQCKCVTAEGCTQLRGLGGYTAYKIDSAE